MNATKNEDCGREWTRDRSDGEWSDEEEYEEDEKRRIHCLTVKLIFNACLFQPVPQKSIREQDLSQTLWLWNIFPSSPCFWQFVTFLALVFQPLVSMQNGFQLLELGSQVDSTTDYLKLLLTQDLRSRQLSAPHYRGRHWHLKLRHNDVGQFENPTYLNNHTKNEKASTAPLSTTTICFFCKLFNTKVAAGAERSKALLLREKINKTHKIPGSPPLSGQSST